MIGEFGCWCDFDFLGVFCGGVVLSCFYLFLIVWCDCWFVVLGLTVCLWC